MAIIGNINLLRYPGAKKVNLGGENGIFIPVEQNPSIYVSGSGAYAGIKVFPFENEFKGKHFSHLCSAIIYNKKMSEELMAKMGNEEFKRITPILGNANEIVAAAPGAFPIYQGGQASNYQTSDSPVSDDLPY